MLLQRIQQQFIDSADLKYQCAQNLAPTVEAAIQAVLASVTGGGKVLACGNGASAAAAQHFAASFIGRYERERPELAAMSLSADAAVLSGIANDFDARAVYARQVRALGHAGDVLLALSTTGNSANMLAAVEAAVFGETACRRKMKLQLVVHLQKQIIGLPEATRMPLDNEVMELDEAAF